MTRARSSGWLLLGLLVLSALVAAELRYEVGKGPGARAVGQDSKPAETAPMPLFALADRDDFAATLERPLFMPDRQALEAGQLAPTAPAAQAPRPDANRYSLSAIIIVDDERVALLTDSATGSLIRVREGERVAGWQVEKILEGSAVLRNGDTREELALRTFGPPAPPRPRSPAQRTRKKAGSAAEREDNQSRAPDRSGPRVRRLRQTQRAPASEAN